MTIPSPLGRFNAAWLPGQVILWPSEGWTEQTWLRYTPGHGNLIALSFAPTRTRERFDPIHESLVLETAADPFGSPAPSEVPLRRTLYQAGNTDLQYRATGALGVARVTRSPAVEGVELELDLTFAAPLTDRLGTGGLHIRGVLTLPAPR